MTGLITPLHFLRAACILIIISIVSFIVISSFHRESDAFKNGTVGDGALDGSSLPYEDINNRAKMEIEESPPVTVKQYPINTVDYADGGKMKRDVPVAVSVQKV